MKNTKITSQGLLALLFAVIYTANIHSMGGIEGVWDFGDQDKKTESKISDKEVRACVLKTYYKVFNTCPAKMFIMSLAPVFFKGPTKTFMLTRGQLKKSKYFKDLFKSKGIDMQEAKHEYRFETDEAACLVVKHIRSWNSEKRTDLENIEQEILNSPYCIDIYHHLEILGVSSSLRLGKNYFQRITQDPDCIELLLSEGMSNVKYSLNVLTANKGHVFLKLLKDNATKYNFKKPKLLRSSSSFNQFTKQNVRFSPHEKYMATFSQGRNWFKNNNTDLVIYDCLTQKEELSITLDEYLSNVSFHPSQDNYLFIITGEDRGDEDFVCYPYNIQDKKISNDDFVTIKISKQMTGGTQTYRADQTKVTISPSGTELICMQSRHRSGINAEISFYDLKTGIKKEHNQYLRSSTIIDGHNNTTSMNQNSLISSNGHTFICPAYGCTARIYDTQNLDLHKYSIYFDDKNIKTDSPIEQLDTAFISSKGRFCALVAHSYLYNTQSEEYMLYYQIFEKYTFKPKLSFCERKSNKEFGKESTSLSLQFSPTEKYFSFRNHDHYDIYDCTTWECISSLYFDMQHLKNKTLNVFFSVLDDYFFIIENTKCNIYDLKNPMLKQKPAKSITVNGPAITQSPQGTYLVDHSNATELKIYALDPEEVLCEELMSNTLSPMLGSLSLNATTAFENSESQQYIDKLYTISELTNANTIMKFLTVNKTEQFKLLLETAKIKLKPRQFEYVMNGLAQTIRDHECGKILLNMHKQS